MLRAVLDTNVFVSGIKSQKAAPGQIIDAWMQKRFTVITSPQLIREIHEVLMRSPILDLLEKTPGEVNEFVKLLLQKTFVAEGKLEIDVLKKDPDDNMVLACAVEGQAKYLVTGNIKHFPLEEYQGIKIVKPQEFVEILNKNKR